MLLGMNPHEEPSPVAVDALRARLRALAAAAGVPEPPLTVDVPRKQDRLPHVREIDGQRTIVVPRSLLEADPARQEWELAACLGRWTSPVPDQRRRQSGIALAVLLVALLVLIFVRPTSWIWITPVLLYPVGSWLLRWERRALVIRHPARPPLPGRLRAAPRGAARQGRRRPVDPGPGGAPARRARPAG